MFRTQQKRDSRAIVASAFLALAMVGSHAAADEAFPSRPIKLVVPYAAGGGTDAIARLVAQGVGEKLGQSVIVENNGTAGGNTATQQAAKAKPDGYTILMANQGPMVVNPHLFKSIQIDPLTAFDPVTLITAVPLVVVVPKNSPYGSLEELVEYGRKNPDKLVYGSAGNGSASHLATVRLAEDASFRAVHAPYKGASPALNDLLGGRLHFMVTTMPSVMGFIESGDVKALAVTSASRAKRLPNVPSVSERGWKDYEATAWYGFAVPKGTPPAITEKIRVAAIDAIKTGILRERLENDGGEPVGNTPSEFSSMMKTESARWADLIKKTALSID